MVNEERWRAARRDRTDEDRPSDRHYGNGGAVREPRESGREDFWGRGHEDSGYERDAHREYSREDYGRGSYGESERGGGFSRGSEEDRGSPAHGRQRAITPRRHAGTPAMEIAASGMPATNPGAPRTVATIAGSVDTVHSHHGSAA
jgi:hypothetical protein